jgi:uncharacterized protein YcfJ
MKTTFSLCLSFVALTSAHAQIFRPEAVNGAVLGGIAGAVIGNNSGDLRHNAWRGAAIGAGAGLIAGEAIGNANAYARGTQVNAPRGSGYIYRDAPTVQIGVGYDRGYHGHAGYYDRRYVGHRGFGYGYGSYGPYSSYGYGPAYGYYSGYGVGYPYYDGYGYYGSGSSAANGLLLGALAGGIIGNNSGDFRHNGWRGAAWGAGAGWLLGSVIDANRRPAVYGSAPVVVQPAPTVQTQAQPAAQSQPQQITIINNYYNSSTPMTAANGLFGR